ncbi:unnamed protein product [Arctia plantaginis]|uniref:Uncharacterized protein n=1 Tax=Arctia plantaginis TaxID=874455 RepID=A0A8S0ZVD5_ARCPL|nr:unnamed protein product [Arctia plantaginis]
MGGWLTNQFYISYFIHHIIKGYRKKSVPKKKARAFYLLRAFQEKVKWLPFWTTYSEQTKGQWLMFKFIPNVPVAKGKDESREQDDKERQTLNKYHSTAGQVRMSFQRQYCDITRKDIPSSARAAGDGGGSGDTVGGWGRIAGSSVSGVPVQPIDSRLRHASAATPPRSLLPKYAITISKQFWTNEMYLLLTHNVKFRKKVLSMLLKKT